MYDEKYEKYESAAERWVYKNIEKDYIEEYNFNSKIELEKLKTIICCHFLLQDIDKTNTGIALWLCAIFIILCVILYKIF